MRHLARDIAHDALDIVAPRARGESLQLRAEIDLRLLFEPGAAERLAAFRDLLASRTSRDWLELFGQKETLVTPLLSVTELATEPHLLDRDWVSDENGFPRTRFPVKFRD